MNAATVILRYLQNWYHLKSTNAHDRYYHIDGRAYVKIHEKPTRICFAPYVPIRTKFDSIDMNSVAETDIVSILHIFLIVKRSPRNFIGKDVILEILSCSTAM